MQLTAVTITLYIFVTLLPYNALALRLMHKTELNIPGWEQDHAEEHCCNDAFEPGHCNTGGKTDCECVADARHKLLSNLLKEWVLLRPKVPQIREEFGGIRILFVGSSTTRRLMYAFDAALQNKIFTDRYGSVHRTVECPDHGKFATEDAILKEHAISLEFRWAPEIEHVIKEIQEIENKHEKWDFIITNTLLHELDGGAKISGEAAALKWQALNDVVKSNRFLLTTENLSPTNTSTNKFIMDYIAQLRKQTFIESKARWLDTSSWMLQDEQSFHRNPCLTYKYEESPHINNHHGQMLRVAQILPVIRAWHAEGKPAFNRKALSDSAEFVNARGYLSEKGRTQTEVLDVIVGLAGCILIILTLRGEGSAMRSDGWTGLRWFISMWIFCEHCHVHPLTGGGAFILLSGAVLGSARMQFAELKVSDAFLFYLRRAARVYPAYWVALGVKTYYNGDRGFLSAVVSMVFEHPKTFFALQAWTDNHMLWFISTILQLYLLLPFICYALNWIGTRKSITKCLQVGGLCFVVQIAFAIFVSFTNEVPDSDSKLYVRSIAGVHVSFYENPFARLPLFVMGILIAHAIQVTNANHASTAISGTTETLSQSSDTANTLSQPSESKLGLATDAAFVALVGLAVISSLSHCCHASNSGDAMGFGTIANRMFLASPIMVLLIFGLGVKSVQCYTKELLTLRPVCILGTWSYGIYLWSEYFIYTETWFGGEGMRNPATSLYDFCAVYGYSLLASSLTYIVVEQPVSKWSEQLISEKS